MIRKILVPLDCSEHAETALPLARHLARQNDAELILFHSDYPKALSTFSDIEITERENAVAYLKTALATEQLAGGVRVTSAMCDGITADGAIVEYSNQNAVDMIVMSTNGKTGIERALIGSTADKVVQTASVPVLLIRPSKHDRPEWALKPVVHEFHAAARERGDS